MAEITQKLGFDVTQAITALSNLDVRLAALGKTVSGLSRRLSNFNKKATTTRDALQRVAKGAGTASNAMASSRASVTSLGISYGTLARIITVQLIQRALGALTRALGQSVQDAIQFQQVVAEIATIDPRGGQGFAEIADEVRALSDAFGADLGDVGRGLYQTISNQIARTGTEAERAAKNYEFLSTSIRLSVAGVTSVESATNLLAGTLNAFGEESSSAERISAQFFKTVELGRTTIGELANSFGTVAPIAGQLGVSIEELQAAFSTITIGGLDTAKAATQIRGVFNSLLKPTKEMKIAFEELGVANGEQLIELFGFQGGLEAVIGTTDGTTESIGRLIPRVRGLSGALRLATKEGGQRFREDLEDIIRANEQLLLDQKLSIILETDSRRLTNDLNRVRNFLTRDFGETLVQVANDIVQAFGGLDNVIDVFDSLLTSAKLVVPILVTLVPVVAALGVKSLIASKNVGLLGKSLGLLAAVGVAVSLGDFVGKQISDLARADINARSDVAKQRRQVAQNIATSEREIEVAKNKLILADTKRFVADLAQLNAGRIRSAKRVADQVQAANENAFSAVLGASEKLESRLRSQFESREGQARDAIDNIRDAEEGLRDAQFQQQTRGLTDRQKFFATERRLQQEQNRVRQQLASAAVVGGDEDAIGRLRDTQEGVQRLAKELETLAESDGNRTLQFRAATIIQTGLKTRIQLERELINILGVRRSVEKAAADEVAENNRQAKQLFAELIEAQARVFEQGLNDDIKDDRFEDFSKKRLEFFALISKNAQVGTRELADFANVLSKTGFAGIVDEELSKAEINQLIISESALANARKQLTDAIEGTALQVGVELEIALRGAGFEGEFSLQRVSEAITNVVDEDQIVNEFQRQITSLTSQIEATLQDLPDIQEQLADNFVGNTKTGENFAALSILLERFSGTIADALSDGVVTPEEIIDIDAARDRLIELRTELEQGFGGSINIRAFDFNFLEEINLAGELNEKLATTLSLQKQLQEQQAGLEGATVDGTDAAARQEVIDAARAAGERANQNRQAAEAAAQETAQVNQVGQAGVQAATGLSAMTVSINQSTQAVGQLQSALNNLAPPNINAPVQTAALGKKITGFAKGGLIPRYFDKGGFASRGTDTIPAMLSPGEFVVNARSTQRFFSQLQAMNAGVQPVFRQDGGPVTNVGDINVSVRSGEDSAGTGRNIARSLKRELRRNTSQL